jgi:hypothetical protein
VANPGSVDRTQAKSNKSQNQTRCDNEGMTIPFKLYAEPCSSHFIFDLAEIVEAKKRRIHCKQAPSKLKYKSIRTAGRLIPNGPESFWHRRWWSEGPSDQCQ